MALGLRAGERPNWSCCHIWGVDDASYQSSNAVVQDRRFFSCVANMLLLPTPLKAFTDVMPEVKMMLRVCALHLYGWTCDHPDVSTVADLVTDWSDWENYPRSWPRPGRSTTPLGMMSFCKRIQASADRRIATIREDLDSAGPHYPRGGVASALSYWGVSL